MRADHLSEPQRRLLAIADNKLSEGAKWDYEALLLELSEIEILAPEIDLTSSAWTVPEIDALYGRQRTEELSECDELGQVERVAVSRLGDRWRLGRHLLGCGDARDAEFLYTLMGGDAARILLSDPPWNLKIEGVVSGKGKNKHAAFAMAAGEMSKSEFVTFLADFLRVSQSHLVDGALLYVFMDWRNLDALLVAACERALEQKNLLVWCKDHGGLGLLYRSQDELIALFKHGDAPHLNNIRMGQHGRNRTNVLFYPGANSFGRGRDAALAAHPTSKPVSLLADIMLDATAPGELVLDPFGGSGSTLIAAERTCRTACLVEFDPVYVDGIIRRFEKLTGQAAVHMDQGRTFAEIALDRAIAAQEAIHAG